MKKTILTIVSILFCISVFSQEAKPCLLLGFYNKKTGDNCYNREMMQIEIADRDEFLVKSKEFRESHANQNANPRFVGAAECIIAYQIDKGDKCNSFEIGIKSGTSLEACYKLLAADMAKNPKKFKTQPKIIFTRAPKGSK